MEDGRFTYEEKQKISERTKEAMANPELRKMLSEKKKGKAPWNKGLKTGHTPWNKGVVGSMSGEKNGMYKNGQPVCPDCGKPSRSYHKGRCRTCWAITTRGENHYKWTGGQDNEISIIRSSSEYKQWRQKVYERDWFTCQICGHKGKDIEAHHIKKVADYKELMLAAQLDEWCSRSWE